VLHSIILHLETKKKKKKRALFSKKFA
jgi:hypothetical protein